MKNIARLLFVFLVILSCKARKYEDNEKLKAIGVAHKTANPHTPYIYTNGYDKIEIVKIPIEISEKTTYLNDLRFHAVSSAMYTKKLMYEKFGMWDKILTSNNQDYPIIVVWKNKKLFSESEKLYTIYASGVESWEKMYASVMVYDEKNYDCLDENNEEKEKIINYFSNGIQNLSKSNEFYFIYKDAVSKFKHERNNGNK